MQIVQGEQTERTLLSKLTNELPERNHRGYRRQGTDATKSLLAAGRGGDTYRSLIGNTPDECRFGILSAMLLLRNPAEWSAESRRRSDGCTVRPSLRRRDFNRSAVTHKQENAELNPDRF